MIVIIENPQNKKQDFSRNLSEPLKQASQLNQEKNNSQDQLAQSEVDIQELKFQQGQYKSHQLTQSQINKKKIEDENLSHFQVSQNEIEEMILTRKNQLEQNYQDLRFNSTAQIREFAEKENTFRTLITCLQNEKQGFSSNLSEWLKQTSQLNRGKNNLQDQLAQSKADIIELTFQQIQFRINYKKMEENFIKLEKFAETNYQFSQNELKETILAYKSELVNLQQQNFQLEQNYQDLRFNSTAQIREFVEKENTLQSLITCLQNEKQALIEQKEQLENQLNQFRINYEQIEQEKIELHDMVKGLSQNQKLTIKLKAKLEKKIVQLEEKIVQLEQKLINEEQIKISLTYT
ncbi:unnamed protein product [Rhizophagus irregularis]|nr:unnamed protein product [Rhizophagus irregularis]